MFCCTHHSLVTSIYIHLLFGLFHGLLFLVFVFGIWVFSLRSGGGGSSTSPEKDEQRKDWWDEFSKRITGPLSQSKSTKKFGSVFKISRKTFNYVCSLSLGLNDQVAVALRRLGSGESLVIIGETFGINQSSVSQITWRFIESMEKRRLLHLKWPSTEAEMTEVKSKFEKMRGLPNCCGAIDTTHIAMSLPTVVAQMIMILQAIVDPDMRFRDIVTGWPGSVNESSALRSSGFFNLCEKGNRLSGKKIQLCKGSELREYIIGDVGFPLLPWLVTPYPGKHLSESKSEFNKRHFATRMVAQRALARLKEMWGILQGTIWRDTNRFPRIILVCCLLHNIVIDMEDEVQDEMPLTHHHDPGYKQQICDYVDKKASMLRDKLTLSIRKFTTLNTETNLFRLMPMSVIEEFKLNC
ncbi:hypothetical protein MKW98_029828 [Papaver atlanticum]|uniref:DDE Tnp4 domain-containing protein n=1 Tax=Papaver atlanticum TaxID=357466 RepID=A0AAD4TJ37_9MAGN|nr:hypothetical protein MKW98_029828 [Papaver atlanticum]